jgi:hypothetical protein
MIFESIDHAREFLGSFDKGHIKHERWFDMPDYDYPNGLRDFSVRFFTALCAPGFMYSNAH